MMTHTAMSFESKDRGPPHERDTRINRQKDALPTVLMNAAWMTLCRGSVLKSTMVHRGNKVDGLFKLNELNKTTS